ncbi:MAG: Druantia anti-phage system protein DruA [Syntrophales bacterium]
MVSSVVVDQSPIDGSLTDYGPVTMTMVRNSPMEPLYNSLVSKHHYLGYRQIVGQHLKYMAFIGERPVACLGWGSAAWSVKSREAFIGWDKHTKENNLAFVVNNTRFLILPWVSIKCLASRLLAMNARRIASDWMAVYQHPVYLLETFVEKERFQGTCYKAANWICVGQTKGTAKRGHDHFVHGLIKDVFLYPLRKDFRAKLIEGR